MKPIKVNNFCEVYNNNIESDLKKSFHFLKNFIGGSSGVTQIINAHDDENEYQNYLDISSLPEDAEFVWHCENFIF